MIFRPISKRSSLEGCVIFSILQDLLHTPSSTRSLQMLTETMEVRIERDWQMRSTISQMYTKTNAANWRGKLILSRNITHLYGNVVEKLARIQPWRRALSANCSEKLWLISLKPPGLFPHTLLTLATFIGKLCSDEATRTHIRGASTRFIRFQYHRFATWQQYLETYLPTCVYRA